MCYPRKKSIVPTSEVICMDSSSTCAKHQQWSRPVKDCPYTTAMTFSLVASVERHRNFQIFIKNQAERPSDSVQTIADKRGHSGSTVENNAKRRGDFA